MNQTPQTGFLESACFATSVNNAILRQQNKRKATFQYDDVSGGNIMTFKRDRGEIQQSGTNLSHSPYHSYYHSSQERSPERKIANSTGTPSSRTNGFTQRTFNNDDHSDDDEDFSTAAEGAYYHHPSWLGMNPNEEEGEAQGADTTQTNQLQRPLLPALDGMSAKRPAVDRLVDEIIRKTRRTGILHQGSSSQLVPLGLGPSAMNAQVSNGLSGVHPTTDQHHGLGRVKMLAGPLQGPPTADYIGDHHGNIYLSSPPSIVAARAGAANSIGYGFAGSTSHTEFFNHGATEAAAAIMDEGNMTDDGVATSQMSQDSNSMSYQSGENYVEMDEDNFVFE
jgi:hypothetical protein